MRTAAYNVRLIFSFLVLDLCSSPPESYSAYGRHTSAVTLSSRRSAPCCPAAMYNKSWTLFLPSTHVLHSHILINYGNGVIFIPTVFR